MGEGKNGTMELGHLTQKMSDDPRETKIETSKRQETSENMEEGVERAVNLIETEITRREKEELPPLLICIGGASGSGKTEFARRLKERLGERITQISMDDYYKGGLFSSDGSISERTHMVLEGLKRAGKITNEQIEQAHQSILDRSLFASFDDKNSFDIPGFVRDLDALLQGEIVPMPNYTKDGSYRTTTIRPTQLKSGQKAVLIEGIFTLDDAIVKGREGCLSIFVDNSIPSSFTRRLIRDSVETRDSRAWMFKYILEIVIPKYFADIDPTKANADLVVQNNYEPKTESTKAFGTELQNTYEISAAERVEIEKKLLAMGAEKQELITQTDICLLPTPESYKRATSEAKSGDIKLVDFWHLQQERRHQTGEVSHFAFYRSPRAQRRDGMRIDSTMKIETEDKYVKPDEIPGLIAKMTSPQYGFEQFKPVTKTRQTFTFTKSPNRGLTVSFDEVVGLEGKIFIQIAVSKDLSKAEQYEGDLKKKDIDNPATAERINQKRDRRKEIILRRNESRLTQITTKLGFNQRLSLNQTYFEMLNVEELQARELKVT